MQELYSQKDHHIHKCECGLSYKHKSNLCRHQVSCDKYQESKKHKASQYNVENNNSITNGSHNTINNTTIHNHNIILVNNFGTEDISYLSDEFIVIRYKKYGKSDSSK